jgi:hypothetical protein
MEEANWTFYGREGCDCCSTAAGFLLNLLRGHRVNLRVVDVQGHPPGGPRAIPAFVDPNGKTVWEGAFDSEASRMALEAFGVLRIAGEPNLQAAA